MKRYLFRLGSDIALRDSRQDWQEGIVTRMWHIAHQAQKSSKFLHCKAKLYLICEKYSIFAGYLFANGSLYV